MKLSLTGVLEDGTPRRPGVPADPRVALNVPRGADVTLEVTVVSSNGAPVDLTGAELRFVVKKQLIQGFFPRIDKLATSVGNIGTIAFGPQDVKLMEEGLYSYDVWLTKAGKRDAVIPTAPFLLQGNVTDLP